MLCISWERGVYELWIEFHFCGLVTRMTVDSQSPQLPEMS